MRGLRDAHLPPLTEAVLRAHQPRSSGTQPHSLRSLGLRLSLRRRWRIASAQAPQTVVGGMWATLRDRLVGTRVLAMTQAIAVMAQTLACVRAYLCRAGRSWQRYPIVR